MPLLLNIFSSEVHINLLLNLGLLKFLVLFVFLTSFSSFFFSFVTETFHGINFNQAFFIRSLDVFFNIFKFFDDLVFEFVSVLGCSSDDLSLLFYEASDSFTNQSFNFNLFLEFFDTVSFLGFSHAIKTLSGCELSMNFSLFVINFKFGLSFTLVDLLSELVDLIRAFSSFFGKLIHFLFKVFVNFSNFVVEILFLLDQSFKIVLFNKLLINIIFEICERLRFGHFFHKFIHFDGKLFFDALDKLLVTGDIWVILKLSAQYSCGILKLLSYNLNLVFGFLELLLL